MTAPTRTMSAVIEEAPPAASSRRQARYEEAVAAHAAALGRLVRAYEADPEQRRDLLQEIHIALWDSFARFDGRCSLRTWVYRVAHNVACSHVQRAHSRRTVELMSLDKLAALPAEPAEADAQASSDRRIVLAQLLAQIQRLAPLERQVILLYLEGMDAASMAEVTGLSLSHVNTKIHRIKKILADRVRGGGGA